MVSAREGGRGSGGRVEETLLAGLGWWFSRKKTPASLSWPIWAFAALSACLSDTGVFRDYRIACWPKKSLA